jgi:hypothetical protein
MRFQTCIEGNLARDRLMDGEERAVTDTHVIVLDRLPSFVVQLSKFAVRR